MSLLLWLVFVRACDVAWAVMRVNANLSGRPVVRTVSRGFSVPASWLCLIGIVHDECDVFQWVGIMVLCPALQYCVDGDDARW